MPKTLLFVLLCLLATVSSGQVRKRTPRKTNPQQSSVSIATVAAVSNLTLRENTPVKLVMPTDFSMSASKIGQQAWWEVAEDVVVDGFTVIPKGSRASAVVSTKFNVGNAPYRLSMSLESVQVAQHGNIPLKAHPSGYKILNFTSSPTNDAAVPEGTEVTALVGFSFTFSRPAAQPGAASTVPVPATPARARVLGDGARVHVQFARAVSSADAQVGDRISFVVVEPVQLGNIDLVPKGAVAWGTVTESKPSGVYGKRGKLSITLDYVQLASGEKAPLRATRDMEGKGKASETWGMMAFSFLYGGVVAGTEEGNDVVIRKGQDLTAYVNGDVAVDLSRWPSALATAVAANSQPATTAEKMQLEVTSVPTGADIELDGKFVGNTPAVLFVPVGEHQVTVSKTGFRSWARKLAPAAGSVRVTAELTSEQ